MLNIFWFHPPKFADLLLFFLFCYKLKIFLGFWCMSDKTNNFGSGTL